MHVICRLAIRKTGFYSPVYGTDKQKMNHVPILGELYL